MKDYVLLYRLYIYIYRKILFWLWIREHEIIFCAIFRKIIKLWITFVSGVTLTGPSLTDILQEIIMKFGDCQWPYIVFYRMEDKEYQMMEWMQGHLVKTDSRAGITKAINCISVFVNIYHNYKIMLLQILLSSQTRAF